MDLPIIEERVVFASEGLALEGMLAYPDEGEPSGAVLLLAPHPHLGGTMDNNVVRHVAAAAAGDGLASLRFNYRGVGRSEICLDPGTSLFAHWEQMEKHLRYDEILPDALAALGLLADVAGSTAITVVGYSLGSVLAGMIAVDGRVDRIVAVAPPVNRVGLEPFIGCSKPKLFVAGDRDFAFDQQRFNEAYATLPEPKHFVPFPDGDHFFRKTEDQLYALIRSALSRHENMK